MAVTIIAFDSVDETSEELDRLTAVWGVLGRAWRADFDGLDSQT
jgi:hypothetical protein